MVEPFKVYFEGSRMCIIRERERVTISTQWLKWPRRWNYFKGVWGGQQHRRRLTNYVFGSLWDSRFTALKLFIEISSAAAKVHGDSFQIYSDSYNCRKLVSSRKYTVGIQICWKGELPKHIYRLKRGKKRRGALVSAISLDKSFYPVVGTARVTVLPFYRRQNKSKVFLSFTGLFFVYFQSFQTNNTILTTNQCEKCTSSIRHRDSNQRPFKHELSPIATRPGLPPKVFLSLRAATAALNFSRIECRIISVYLSNQKIDNLYYYFPTYSSLLWNSDWIAAKLCIQITNNSR